MLDRKRTRLPEKKIDMLVDDWVPAVFSAITLESEPAHDQEKSLQEIFDSWHENRKRIKSVDLTYFLDEVRFRPRSMVETSRRIHILRRHIWECSNQPLDPSSSYVENQVKSMERELNLLTDSLETANIQEGLEVAIWNVCVTYIFSALAATSLLALLLPGGFTAVPKWSFAGNWELGWRVAITVVISIVSISGVFRLRSRFRKFNLGDYESDRN